MKSYRHSGELISFTNGATPLAPDTVVEIATGNSGCIGVTVDSVPANGTGVLRVQGVVELPAATSAWTRGARLFWNGTGLTATAGTFTYAGRAVTDKAAPATSGEVRLGVA